MQPPTVHRQDWVLIEGDDIRPCGYSLHLTFADWVAYMAAYRHDPRNDASTEGPIESPENVDPCATVSEKIYSLLQKKRNLRIRPRKRYVAPPS